MNTDQLKEAVAQARSHVAALEDAYNLGTAEYAQVTVREVLYTLGFTGDETDEVIRYIAERGFDYCLDPIIESPGTYPDFKPGPTPGFACYWGVDQLRSRLDCVR